MDILDTRNLNKRMEELQDLQNFLEEIEEEWQTAINEDENEEIIDEIKNRLGNARDDFSENEAKELAELEEISQEIDEWSNGVTLINEDYWIEYVQEMLADCGDIPRDLPRYIVIDWKSTAENIQYDYSCVEYQGERYYWRQQHEVNKIRRQEKLSCRFFVQSTQVDSPLGQIKTVNKNNMNESKLKCLSVPVVLLSKLKNGDINRTVFILCCFELNKKNCFDKLPLKERIEKIGISRSSYYKYIDRAKSVLQNLN